MRNFSKKLALLPPVGQLLLKDWCKAPWFTICHCLPITSSEIDLIWHPILECRMNQPGVVKIHSWFTPQTADCKLRKMPGSSGCWMSLESTALFNDDAITPANFQFRFAITFRPCYFTPRADSAIMPHHIDREFISKEKVLPVFYWKTEPFILAHDCILLRVCILEL